MIKYVLTVLAMLMLIGCNEENKKALPIPKYEDIKIVTVEILTKDGKKDYSAFSDLIFEDTMNDYLGFVYVTFCSINDENGIQTSSYMKPVWMEFKGVSYLSGVKVELRFNKKDIATMQESNIKAYNLAREIFQINKFLYEQDQISKNRK